MSSAQKALSLLSHFSENRPEIGLSDMCRMANRDKATTYRHLQVLEQEGFVEQNPSTKTYRLGPALLRLAKLREATVPRASSAQPILRHLADISGETAHASVMSAGILHSIASCESAAHSTRVIIDVKTLPLHATASGLCVLAHSAHALSPGDLEGFTKSTARSDKDLHRHIATARDTGFGYADSTFEADTLGIAAPVFDATETCAGAISVASVATRMTPQLEALIKTELARAARDLSQAWGGTLPEELEHKWADLLPAFSEMEIAQ